MDDDQVAEDRAVEQEARAVVRGIHAGTTTRRDEDEGTAAVVDLLRKHEFEVMRRMALSIDYMIDQFPVPVTIGRSDWWRSFRRA